MTHFHPTTRATVEQRVLEVMIAKRAIDAQINRLAMRLEPETMRRLERRAIHHDDPETLRARYVVQFGDTPELQAQRKAAIS